MSNQPIKSMAAYTLALACRAHGTRVRVLLNEIGLHPGQEMFLLSVWEEEGLTQTELAQRLGVRRATVTNSVTRLEKASFIERRPDAKDGRVYRIYLTEKGSQTRAAQRSVWEQMEADMTKGLAPAEKAMLQGLLSRVIDNLSDCV